MKICMLFVVVKIVLFILFCFKLVLYVSNMEKYLRFYNFIVNIGLKVC